MWKDFLGEKDKLKRVPRFWNKSLSRTPISEPKRRSPRNQVSVNKNRIQLDVERFSRRKGQIKKSSEVLEQVSITNPNLRTFNTLKINLFEFDQNIENIE